MRKNFKILFSVIVIGCLSGLFSGVFLLLLEKVTNFRLSHSLIIYFLPVFGFFYKKSLIKAPGEMSYGLIHILQTRSFSPWLAPFNLLASLGTHLFGGSAGREGVGVIMGAGSAQIFSKSGHLKDLLIPLGIASGFSSIFGTPLAGVIFSLELEKFKTLSLKKIILLSLSSYIAYVTSQLITPHTSYPSVSFKWEIEVISYLVASSLAVSVAGHLFFESLKRLTQLRINIVWMSLLIVAIIFVFNAERFTGIGIDLLQESLGANLGVRVFILKLLLTVLTLSVGFKGGEVTPIFIMGASFSNFIADQLGLKNFPLSGSLGMLGLFGALAHAPFTAGIMALEIFNWETAILVFFTSSVGKIALRKKSIYH